MKPKSNRLAFTLESVESKMGVKEITNEFHSLYYNSTVWLKDTLWMGIPVQKCPLDLHIYQELIFKIRPDLIIETGTACGGGALFLANVCDLIDHGQVVTIDVTENKSRPQHKRITYIKGSSIETDTLQKVTDIALKELKANIVMAIFDAGHNLEFVREEMHYYASLITPGSYMIVEDTNVNGHPVFIEHGPGPAEAVTEFLAKHPEFEVDRNCEKFFMTQNPGGYLRKKLPSSQVFKPLRNVVKITYSPCRFGNHLFQHIAGRLLAERLNAELSAKPTAELPGTNTVLSKDLSSFHVLEGVDPIPSWPDIESLRGKNLEIKNGFYNSKYFIQDREHIKTWISPAPTMQVDPDDVLINVRLGDFMPGQVQPLGLVIDPSYYEFVLSRIKFKNLYLMTDGNPNDSYFDWLKKYEHTVISGYGLEHFNKALAFKRIIMSNSTFCWWFTFLSNAAEIYFPMANGSRCGAWCTGQLPGIDLRLDLPEVTHVYNVPYWQHPEAPLGEVKRAELAMWHKKSKIVFL